MGLVQGPWLRRASGTSGIESYVHPQHGLILPTVGCRLLLESLLLHSPLRTSTIIEPNTTPVPHRTTRKLGPDAAYFRVINCRILYELPCQLGGVDAGVPASLALGLGGEWGEAPPTFWCDSVASAVVCHAFW